MTPKRPSEADKSKWVISNHLESAWVTEPIVRDALPVVLDLGIFYEKLLEPLMLKEVQSAQPIQVRIDWLAQIKAQRREVDKIDARLRKETHFRKKVAINAELRKSKQKLT